MKWWMAVVKMMMGFRESRDNLGLRDPLGNWEDTEKLESVPAPWRCLGSKELYLGAEVSLELAILRSAAGKARRLPGQRGWILGAAIAVLASVSRWRFQSVVHLLDEGM